LSDKTLQWSLTTATVIAVLIVVILVVLGVWPLWAVLAGLFIELAAGVPLVWFWGRDYLSRR
jgi:hypothetical protein